MNFTVCCLEVHLYTRKKIYTWMSMNIRRL